VTSKNLDQVIPSNNAWKVREEPAHLAGKWWRRRPHLRADGGEHEQREIDAADPEAGDFGLADSV
jgi:hypothetical protein